MIEISVLPFAVEILPDEIGKTQFEVGVCCVVSPTRGFQRRYAANPQFRFREAEGNE